MKTIARYGFILGLICVLTGGLLAFINALTEPKIIAQALERERKTLLEVLPQAARFDPVKASDGEIVYYKAYDQDNNMVGFALKASGKGYSGVIESMVGITLDGKISMIKILSQNETPGLGNRISGLPFTSQFKNKDIESMAQVQAIAGATISSKAIIESVKVKLKEAQTFKDEK